jgi:ATP-dependent protease HslVU (ClpYQ) peptidase subunit
MTTLVAIQGNGWAVIGSDSLSTDDNGRPINMATPKIVKNGPYLIAGAGSVRGCNILQHGWTPPKPRGDLDRFMTKTFIPAMRKAFLDAGYDMKQDSSSALHDSEFIVIVHGVIYPIFEDYSWERSIDPFYVSGSGGAYALGCLKALKEYMSDDEWSARGAIEKAISVAIECDTSTGGSIYLASQKDMR